MVDIFWLAPALFAAAGIPMLITEFSARRIPNTVVIITIVLLIAAYSIYDPSQLFPRIIGGILGSLMLFIIGYVKHVGFGDVKYAFPAGILTGWKLIFPALAIAALFTIAVFLPYMLYTKKSKEYAIPFGPFIFIGSITTYFLARLPFFNFLS